MAVEPAALLEPAITLAAAAAERIMAIYERGFAVERKADESPLTEADLASHETLVTGLRRLTPDLPVLSEESAAASFTERARWQRFWLIDPLDGTREFIKRIGEFTVNVALIDGHEPVLGVVWAPVTGMCYFAARGHGAFCREPNGTTRPIAVAPLGVGPVRVAGSRSHAGKSLELFLRRLGEYELLSMGSSLKFCLVAEGRADVYPRLGPTSEWDTAAAQCVVEQAGGQVVAVDGRRMLYNTRESLLNPHFLVVGDGRRDWLAYLSAQG